MSRKRIFILIVAVVALSLIELAAVASGFALFFTNVEAADQEDARANRDRLADLKQELAALIPYPNSKLIRANYLHRWDRVTAENIYWISADYPVVKDYYSRQLVASGWKLQAESSMREWFTDYGGKMLLFCRKGETAQLYYAGERKVATEWNYTLVLKWVPHNAECSVTSREMWTIDHYDILPDKLVIYTWPWSDKVVDFDFTSKPRFGLNAQTSPSAVYDYYNPDSRRILPPTRFTVR